jgi:surface antigen
MIDRRLRPGGKLLQTDEKNNHLDVVRRNPLGRGGPHVDRKDRKMKKIVSAVMAASLVLALAACEGSNYGQKQTGGAVIGGAAGGLLGSQVGGGTGRLAATAAGALIGLLVGSEVGKSLDRADRLHAQQTTQQSLETAKTGTTATWTNPDSGHSGTVTPTKTYQSAEGQYCREYQQTVTVGGKTENAYGTACRQPDGSWKVVN